MSAQYPYRIILSKRVSNEFERIFNYVVGDSSRGASGLILSILDGIDALVIFPHRTKVPGQMPSAPQPVRSLPVGSYIVYFKVIEADRVVLIMDVRHGARRQPKRFR